MFSARLGVALVAATASGVLAWQNPGWNEWGTPPQGWGEFGQPAPPPFDWGDPKRASPADKWQHRDRSQSSGSEENYQPHEKFYSMLHKYDEDNRPAQERAPKLDGFTQSVWVPFANGSAGMGDQTPALKISMPGMPHPVPVMMDTGSTGFMMSFADMEEWNKNIFHPLRDYYEAGAQYLVSSKVLNEGYWIPMEVEFADAPGTKARVPVLAITRTSRCMYYDNDNQKCHEGHEVDGSIKEMPKGARYLGVGFGREGDGQAHSTPDKNLLLHIEFVNGQPVINTHYQQGYIVTKDGIWLGLTPQDTQDFKWQKLKRKSDLPMDWAMATMCVRIDNPSGGRESQDRCATGFMLVDTGVASMYLTMPESWKYGVHTHEVENKHTKGEKSHDLDNGAALNMNIPYCSHWGFVQGQHSPTEPDAVYTSLKDPYKTPPFVNTGRHFLKEHDVAFDAITGWFGVRPHVEGRA